MSRKNCKRTASAFARMKNNLMVVFLFSCLYLSGCSYLDSFKKIKKLEQGPIAFPTNVLVIKDAMTETSWNRPEDLPILVVFIDSLECTDCHLNHIRHNVELFELSKKTNKFSMVCVISPSKNKEKELLAKLANKYNYSGITYLIDRDNVFYDLNPNVPYSAKYHEFLIDKDDYPILIGNPLNNNRLFNHFLSLVL